MKSHSDKKDIKGRYGFLIIIFLYIAFSVFTYISPVVHFDEKEYHLPNLNLFYESDFCSASTSPEYLSANTPLPYFLSAGLFRVLNTTPSIKFARIINALASLFAIFFFALILKDEKILIPTLILFFHPYFVKPSFLYFMSIYGLLFFLLFIYLIQKDKLIYAFCGGASLALAVLSQQFYLIVIPFYLLFKLFSVKGRITLGLFIELSLFSIPFLPVIILFVVWNGLAHPNFQAWGLDFHIEYFTGILLVSGSVLFPYTIFKIKEIKRNSLISVILISVILSLFVFPIWTNTPIPGYISGLNFQAISRVESLNRFLGLLIKVFLISNGILGLILIVINKGKTDLFFLFMLLSFIIGFLIFNMLSERHMLPLMVLLFLIVFKFLKDIKYPHLWAAWQVLVGSVYFYYILFAYKLPVG